MLLRTKIYPKFTFSQRDVQSLRDKLIQSTKLLNRRIPVVPARTTRYTLKSPAKSLVRNQILKPMSTNFFYLITSWFNFKQST